MAPTRRPPSTTGAALMRWSDRRSKMSGSGVAASTTTRSRDITLRSCVKRSKPAASPSVKMPTGSSPSTTITAPWDRLWISESASPTVPVGGRVIGVS